MLWALGLQAGFNPEGVSRAVGLDLNCLTMEESPFETFMFNNSNIIFVIIRSINFPPIYLFYYFHRTPSACMSFQSTPSSRTRIPSMAQACLN